MGRRAAPPVSPRIVDAETAPLPVPRHRSPRNLGRARGLGRALLITTAAAVLPGSGHLLLRRRVGWLILCCFVGLLGAAAVLVLRVPRSALLEYGLSTQVLRIAIVGCALLGLAWVAVVLRTYVLARPRRLRTGPRVGGAGVALLLCLAVLAPFGFGAYLANTQRNLLETLFPHTGGASDAATSGASDALVIGKPRINIFLIGSDAGPDRDGIRTDTLVVASIDTRTGRTTLFSLPRNIEFAQFPPSSPMARRFPSGFHDSSDPTSGDYLLNAVYAYGNDYPWLAPAGPSPNRGLNLLSSSVTQMLGLTIDYYIQVDMQGFATIIDALGGLNVDVGPTPIPMGGIGPFGGSVKPFGYIPPGRQHLEGEQALWFARSRTNISDYDRMGRQRCLIQYLVDQKSPIDVLQNFQAVAAATTDSLSTNIPRSILPALVALARKARERPLESVSFDPSLPDPGEPDGRFSTARPDFWYMRRVVRNALDPSPAPTSTPAQTTPTPSAQAGSAGTEPGGEVAPLKASAAPTSLAGACGPAGAR